MGIQRIAELGRVKTVRKRSIRSQQHQYKFTLLTAFFLHTVIGYENEKKSLHSSGLTLRALMWADQLNCAHYSFRSSVCQCYLYNYLARSLYCLVWSCILSVIYLHDSSFIGSFTQWDCTIRPKLYLSDPVASLEIIRFWWL